MLTKKSYFTLLCFLFSLFGFSQLKEATINGVLRDNVGKTISGANVNVKGTNKRAITKDNGSFSISGNFNGTYVVEVSYLSYKSTKQTISLSKGEIKQLSIILEESNNELDEVTLKSKTKTQKLKESEFSVNAIDTKSFQNKTTNLNQILDQTTGIRVRQSGGVGSDVNFSINGLSGNAVKYFVDGIPIEAMGNVLNLNNLPVNLTKSLQVYKGVVPVDFGADAMGGIVNIETNKSVKSYLDASYGFGSFNTHQAALIGQYTQADTGFVIKANSFYNFSENNYIMRDVEVFDNGQNRYVKKDLSRFHDNYVAAMGQIEAGFQNKKWADLFLVGGSYSIQDNDIQTGATQKIVYGGAERKSNAYNFSVRYKKQDFLIKKLKVNLFASYVKDKFQVIDTTFRRYAWDQNYDVTNYAEISGGTRSIRHFERPKKFLIGNLSYKLNESNSFNLNYNYEGFKNISFDEYSDDLPTEDNINKQILGLAYQQNFKNKLLTSFFVKRYGLDVATEIAPNYRGDYTATDEVNDGRNVNYGYGIATNYKFKKNIGVKVSYEKSYRLQTPDELLGNGITIVPNLNLRPENSDNFNIGSFIGFNLGEKHTFFAEAGWFYRNAKDFIYTVVYEDEGLSQYKNVSNVRIDGFEGELKYSYSKLFTINLNASYQNAINTTKGNGNVPELTYLNRIPNRPWVFGNAGFSIGKNDVLTKNSRLDFNWNLQYIHWFYLTWDAFGSKKSKPVIPTQTIQDVSVSYSLKNGKYNFSLECKNLTDELAYDNFMLQKAGRGFYFKFRYFLN